MMGISRLFGAAISTSHLCASRYHVTAKYSFCRIRLRRQCGGYTYNNWRPRHSVCVTVLSVAYGRCNSRASSLSCESLLNNRRHIALCRDNVSSFNIALPSVGGRMHATIYVCLSVGDSNGCISECLFGSFRDRAVDGTRWATSHWVHFPEKNVFFVKKGRYRPTE